MRKNIEKFQIVLLMAISLLSCEKDNLISDNNDVIKGEDFSKNSSLKEVTHLYDYYGESFEVTYLFDTETNEMVDVSGDTEKAEQILGNGPEDQALLYEYKGEEDPDYIEMKIFDTREELLKETRSNTKSSDHIKNQKNDCYDIDSYGPADYIFNSGINQGGNILVQGNGKEEFSLQWLGNNNDRISSFMGQCILRLEMEITLFEHSCRTGKTLTFIKPYTDASIRVNDLRNYTLSGWWFWRVSWNDQTSSFYADVYRP